MSRERFCGSPIILVGNLVMFLMTFMDAADIVWTQQTAVDDQWIQRTSTNSPFATTVNNRKAINIGAFFPMSAEKGGWAGGEACLPAAQMALDDINRRDVIPDYYLNMTFYDSQCQIGLGAKRLYDLLYTDPTKIVLLSGCSLVSTLVADTAHLWNLIVLSYGASSPALSNRHRFPSLFRTHPSANFHNPARVALFKQHNWKKVAILQSAQEVFTSTAKDLERRSEKAGIQIISRQSFVADPTDAVKSLKTKDARIIVGLFYEKEARKVFCEAYHSELYGGRYVWFLIGWYSDNWYVPVPGEGIDCSQEEMNQAVQGHLTTEAIMLNEDEGPTIMDKTGPEFVDELKGKLQKAFNETTGFVEAPLAYDAMWALALAFNCTKDRLQGKELRLEDFTYKSKEIYEELYACMNMTDFMGVSGRVMFSDSGDRIAVALIEQMRDGQYHKLGQYNHDVVEGDRLQLNQSVKFENGPHPPPDSTPTKEMYRTVSRGLYWAVAALSIIGILLATYCVIFNFQYSHRRYIIESEPISNNLLLFGCILCMTSLFLHGLPAGGIPVEDWMFPILCHSRIGLLMIGFSMGYGALFIKVLQVHRLGAAGNADGRQGLKATMTLVEMLTKTVGRVDPEMEEKKRQQDQEKLRRESIAKKPKRVTIA